MSRFLRTGRAFLGVIAPFLLILLALQPVQEKSVPDPSMFLGIEVGADKVLADWGEIGRYFRTVADVSDRVDLIDIGSSQNKRPMFAALISSEENLANLHLLLNRQRELTWLPRQQDEVSRWADSRVFVLINCSMHSTEIAASQMAMLLLHRLATEESEEARLARERLVVVLVPSSNPDGIDWVTEWYRKYLGTPYEGSAPPFLYQEYAGHDNNRDWFMLNLRETQVINDFMVGKIFPHIVWDAHQMGGNGIRAFVPPFLGPPNPMIHPLVLTGIENAGHAMRAQMLRDGHRGISHSISFSVWWNGGFRTAPYFRNSIGLLTELASARLATPANVTPEMLRGGRGGFDPTVRSVRNPAPWMGGAWRLRDIIDYEMSAARGLINYAAVNAARIIADYRAMSLDAIEMKDGGPAGWIIPADQRDPGATDRLINILLDHGLLLKTATRDLAIGEHKITTGSIVIPGGQPFRPMIRSLMERIVYPDGLSGEEENPYDVSAWTLTDMLGVEVLPVSADEWKGSGIDTTLDHLKMPDRHPLMTSTGLTFLPSGDSHSYRAVARILSEGGFVEIDRRHPDGPMFVHYDPGRDASAMDISGVIQAARENSLKLPRLALLRGNFNSMDEGWTRWLLEQFGFPLTSLDEKQIGEGDLRRDFDCIILPNMSEAQLIGGGRFNPVPPEYQSGIGLTGLQTLEKFVLDGGTLICFGQAAQAAIVHFELPVADVTRGLRSEEFSIPGSLVKIKPETAHPLVLGLAPEIGAMYDRSTAFDIPGGRGDAARVVARYAAADELLLSGHVKGAEKIAGKAALVVARHGMGSVVLFGFQPQFRGQTWATFKFIFNAILWAGSGDTFAGAPAREK